MITVASKEGLTFVAPVSLISSPPMPPASGLAPLAFAALLTPAKAWPTLKVSAFVPLSWDSRLPDLYQSGSLHSDLY